MRRSRNQERPTDRPSDGRRRRVEKVCQKSVKLVEGEVVELRPSICISVVGGRDFGCSGSSESDTFILIILILLQG